MFTVSFNEEGNGRRAIIPGVEPLWVEEVVGELHLQIFSPFDFGWSPTFFFFYGLWCGPRTLLTHFWKHTSNLAPRRWLWRALTPRSDNMTSFLLWPESCRRARLQSGGTRVVSPYRRSPSPPVGHRFELAPAPSALSRHGRWQLRRSHAPGASVSAEVSMTPTCFLALNLSGEPHLINDQSRFGPKLAIPASSLANYLALR